MNYYAHVHFGKDERDQQRRFLQLMNSTEIIQISQEEIDNWYDDDAKLNVPGYDNHIVLHSEEERARFTYAMNAFMPKKVFYITDSPESEEFEKWLKEKEEKKRGES